MHVPEIDDVAMVADADGRLGSAVLADSRDAVVKVTADLRQPTLTVTLAHGFLAHLSTHVRSHVTYTILKPLLLAIDTVSIITESQSI